MYAEACSNAKPSRLATTATLFVVSLLALGQVRAAKAEEPAKRATEEVVVTGTRTPELSQRATVKTDVVTQEEAQRRGATNVAEALSTQPGVQVNPGAYGYLGNISPIQIQGFDMGRVLILEDGEPVIGNVGGAVDLASMSVADVERIEIVTGPTSALYGSSAIGGVVNILSAAPREQGLGGRARVELRSHRGVVAQGGASLRKGGSWVAMDLGFTRQDGLPVSDDAPDLRLPETSRALIGVRAGTRLSERSTVQVRARLLHQALDGLESKVYPGAGRYFIDLPTRTSRVAVQVLETIRFGHGSSLRLSIARQWADALASNRVRSSPLGQTQASTERMQSLEATATFADCARTWVVGARFQAQNYAQELTKTESVAGRVVTSSVPEIVPHGLGSAAAYAQLQWKFGRVLTLLPGVRAEHHGRQGGVVAPRFAVAVRPTETVTLRASAGRGFRTPSAKELGFDFDHSVYGYRVVGNAGLSPEQSWGVNGDLTWRPASGVVLRGGAFMNWVDRLIDLDVAGGVASSSIVTYSYKNFDKVRTFGGQLGAAFRIDERVRTEVTYDYLWTRDDENDVPLSGRPPHTVTTSVTARLPWKLEAYARGRFVTSAFVDRSARTPGYATVDLRLGRDVWPAAQIYAGVLNLLDVHQQTGRVGDLRPPLGRVVYIGFRAAFPWEEP